MSPFEIEQCLKSMIVLVDTREQPTKRAERRYMGFNVPYQRQHLNYGDYAYNFILPDGHWLYVMDQDVAISPDVVIERKEDLTELSGNLCQNKARFENEFQRAAEHHAKVYLLVENANMENLYNGRYRTNFHPNAYSASLWAVVARNNIHGPIFCKEETSGRVIHDILYRELKARLERGEYD